MCQHLSDTGVSTGVGTVSTGVGIDMSGYIRTCPSGFKRWISGYPDIRISGYLDMSGYPREHGHIWTQDMHAGTKHSTSMLVAGPFHQHTQHTTQPSASAACASLKPARASSQCWEGFVSWKSSRTARSASFSARTTSSSSTQVHSERPWSPTSSFQSACTRYASSSSRSSLTPFSSSGTSRWNQRRSRKAGRPRSRPPLTGTWRHGGDLVDTAGTRIGLSPRCIFALAFRRGAALTGHRPPAGAHADHAELLVYHGHRRPTWKPGRASTLSEQRRFSRCSL
jgi:hypothetical protein